MKRMLIGLALACGALALHATEITADQARRAVECWKSMSAAVTGDVVDVRTHRDVRSGANFHVAKLSKQGFVITAADDEQDPIVGFSASGEFSASPGSPLWEVLCRTCAAPSQTASTSGVRRLSSVATGGSPAMTSRTKWDILLGGGMQVGSLRPRKLQAIGSNSGKSKFFHTSIYGLVKTHWSQGGVGDLRCYDMYTPVKEKKQQSVRQPASGLVVFDNEEELDGEHCPCGCVATAGAQLMKYFEHPTARVAKRTNACRAFGKSVMLETRGEKYRWSDMPDRPSAATPQSMREAIGTLTYDVGVVCGAFYDIDETSASAYSLASALTDVFGYSQAVYFDFYNSGALPRTVDSFSRIVVPNLISGKPVLMSMQGGDGGHEVVVDGYGYDGSYGRDEEELYVHLNFGWAGQCDLWFRPPLATDPILASTHRYNYFDSLIANISKTGGGSIVAGRVRRWDPVTECNYPVHLVKVQLAGRTSGGVAVSKECETDSEGHYHFIVSPGDYELYAYQSSGPSQSVHHQVQVETCARTRIGNVLCDIQLDEAATAATPVVNQEQLLKNILDVTCSMSEATIRYTDDGTDPTMLSHLYVGPIGVWRSGEYRFAAFAPGMARSQVVSVSLAIAKWKTDSFEQAGELRGESGSVELTNDGASREDNEPYHGDYQGGASVWTSFTPDADGDYTFTVNGKDVGTGKESFVLFAAYTGDTLLELQEVASDCRYADCRISLHAKAGVTYHLAIDTYQGVASDLVLNWAPGFYDTIELENEGTFASSAGGCQTIGITCTAPWKVTSSPSWVTVMSEAGDPDAPLVFEAQPNATGKVRTGNLTIACGNAEAVAVTVTQGTLNWLKSRAEALDAATNSGKPILLVYGRETCPNTRSTMFSSCEDSSLRGTLDSEYVLWFCNCDLSATRSEGTGYFSNSGYSTLPFVCVIDPKTPDSCLLHAGSYQSASNLSSLLSRAKKIPALAASQGTSPENVTLSWAAVPGATEYVVYRGSAANSLSVLKRGVTSLSYSDETADEGAKYFYAVAAVINGSTAGLGIPVSGYRQLAASVVKIGKSTNESWRFAPALSWSSVTGAKYYFVTRRYEDGTEYTNRLTTTSWLDAGYAAGRSATYTVVAARDSRWDSNLRIYVPVDPGRASVAVSHLDGASISFDPGNGDTYLPRYSYDFGGEATYLYTPSYDGHRFDGWYTARTGGERVTAPLTVSERYTTLYAHWTPYAYRVDPVVPEAIYESTPLVLVATVTNLPTGRLVVTNASSWRILSGTAAVVDQDGRLIPVASTGSVSVEGRAEFWGQEHVRKTTVDVIRLSDITSLAVEGPTVVDLYDSVGAQYRARIGMTNGKTYLVDPLWSVAESAVTNAVVDSDGYVSFSNPSKYSKASTLTVTASYQGRTTRAEATVWGWYAQLVSWTTDCRVLYPGCKGEIRPCAIRWWRHGVLEPPTADLTGTRLVVSYGWINNSTSFRSDAGDGSFIIPSDVPEPDGYAYPYPYVASERFGRTVTHQTACWMSYLSAAPSSLTTVTFESDGGLPAVQTVKYATGRTFDYLPTVVKSGYSFLGWYTERTGGRRVYSSEVCSTDTSRLYGRWTPATCTVRFASGGGSGEMPDEQFTNGTVRSLPRCTFTPPSGKCFVGWACSNGKRYDDGMLVFNLAESGETVTMTAIWE